MDESTLRNYFRKAIGVQPGASRKELRLCRDKRAQRWRAMMPPPEEAITPEGQAKAKLAEQRLSITNIAYDCLSNADKFREYQNRLRTGESHLPDLDSLLDSLGEENVKPIAPRVLAKRQAQLQEKIERIMALATESVQKAGHDQALKLTQGKLPDADQFYDSVYKTARDAGNNTCEEELKTLSAANLEIDETFKSELDSLVIDQAEMIAHREYDRLEDRAASSARTPAMPRFVALILTVIIMGLVISVCFYGVTTPTPVRTTGSSYYQAPAPIATPTPNVMPSAPAPGIANSVFNHSTFGAPNSAVVPPVDQSAQTAVNTAVTTPPVASSNYAPAPAPATASQTDAAAQQNYSAPAVVLSANEITGAEVSPVVTNDPPKSLSMPGTLVGYAGAAGMAGYGKTGTKAGGASYAGALAAAMRGSYDESLAGFRSAFAAGHFKEAIYNEAVVLVQQGRFQPALEAYGRLLKEGPVLPQALYNRGHCHQFLALAARQRKDYSEWRKQLHMAVNNYDLAIKVDPRLSQAFYNRGLAHYDLGEADKAVADFTSANQLSSLMPAASYNRDLLQFALKNSKQAPAGSVPSAPVGPVGPSGPV